MGQSIPAAGKAGTASAKVLGQECTGCVHGIAARSVFLEQHEPAERVGRNEDREMREGQAHSLSNSSSLS